MNSYYSLRYLAFELNAILDKAAFMFAATGRKNELGLYFSKDQQDLKILVSTDPQRTAVFADPRVSVKKTNTVSFFSDLEGKRVKSVSTAEADRFMYVHFEDSVSFLAFKLFGNDPNVFLTNGDIILETFKNPGRFEGAPVPGPLPLRTLKLSEAKGNLRKKIMQAFPQIPRTFLDDLIDFHKLNEMSADAAESVLQRIHYQLLHQPEPRILEDGRLTLFSEAHYPVADAERFQDLNTAVRVVFFSEKRENTLAKQLLFLRKRADKLRQRYESALREADNAQKSIEKAEWYEQTGNILMANAHVKVSQTDEIELVDFYNEGQYRRIALDPRMDLAANAARYFGLKKKAERAFETAAAYAELTGERYRELQEIEAKFADVANLKDLEAIEHAHAQHELFRKKQGDTSENIRPFKTGRIGRYEVWIGKNAKSNDHIMRDSHKDDIWMHAKGVPGSHVLIRMNRAQTEPDLTQLETAAGWAAWFSKAKGSSFAPVIKTRRKFVRKPKQGAPGAVLIDREEVLIVPPLQPRPEDLED